MSVRSWFPWKIRCLFVLIALPLNVTAGADYESAPYQVIDSDGKFEIREYPDLVLASTESKFEARGNDGSFMRLFRYISGNNDAKQEIQMTTPVFMEQDSANAKGKMGFVMPQEIAQKGAPKPTASDVAIRTREGGRFAVIRFSGIATTKKYESKEAELRAWLNERGLQGEEAAERAGYDAPFTPGPLRRNEVLIRLKPKADASAPGEPKVE